MVNNRSGLHLSKKIPAIAMALAMTLTVGFGTAAVGANALLNHNVSPILDAAPNSQQSSNDASAIQQLQGLVTQYQEREQQYQAREQQYNQEIQQAAQELNNARAQIQQYQALLAALQNAGLIRIGQNGQIFVPQRVFGGNDDEGNGG